MRVLTIGAALAVASLIQMLMTDSLFGVAECLRLTVGIAGLLILEGLLTKPLFQPARVRIAAILKTPRFDAR